MAAKSVFTNSLKELRFLFCQTGEQSAGVRFVDCLHLSSHALMGGWVSQVVHSEIIPEYEET